MKPFRVEDQKILNKAMELQHISSAMHYWTELANRCGEEFWRLIRKTYRDLDEQMYFNHEFKVLYPKQMSLDEALKELGIEKEGVSKVE